MVELLVVIAIFGLLSVVLFGGFRFATRTVTVATGRLDRAGQLTLAASFLRNQLADIRPFPAASGDRFAVAFVGEPDAITFVAAPPAYLGPGGFHALRIAVEVDGAERRLMLHWQPMPGEAAAEPSAIRPSVLLDDIAGAAFAYFGPASSRQTGWQESWDGAAGLPALIRLRVRFADGSAAPDLVVAVHPAEEGIR